MEEANEVLAAVGRRIAGYRAGCGWSQQELADAAGVNRVTISRVERGLQDLGVRRLLTLTRVLGCSPDDILLPDPDADSSTTL